MKSIPIFIVLLALSVYTKAGIVVNNGLSHIYQVTTGSVTAGEIALENTSATPQTVKIYLQDLSYNASGATFYCDPSGKPTSNAGWIKIQTQLVTLQANEKAVIPYEIHLPDSSLQKGSYWSTIMVEPTVDPGQGAAKAAITIQSVVRYAIQIITNYQTADLRPNIKFDSVSIKKTRDKRYAQVAITNTGNLYIRPTTQLELYDPKSGEKTGTYSSLPMSILPGNAKTFQIDISNAPPGKYSAVLMATDSADNAFALHIALDIKNE